MKVTHEALSIMDTPIRIQKFVNHHSGERVHWHEEIELLYFAQGSGVISCNLKEYAVKEGDIVLFNGKELHTGLLRGEDTVYYCLHIGVDFFHNWIGKEYVIFHNVIQDEACEALVLRMLEQQTACDFKGVLAMKRLAFELFDLLSAKHVRLVLAEEAYKKQFHRLDTFNDVITYIHRHFSEELSLQQLADRFFISASYLSHLFKRCAGKGVVVYINEVRIQHAALLLEKRELSMGEISRQVGFGDLNYFSRKFKAVMGRSPTEYRAKSN